MTLLLRQTDPNKDVYTPGRLLDADTDAPESDLKRIYIYGKFEETDVESYGNIGRQREVNGVITVPMLYKTLLAQAEYIDPYNDGSRFTKDGAAVDEGRLFITQSIRSLSLKSVADPT